MDDSSCSGVAISVSDATREKREPCDDCGFCSGQFLVSKGECCLQELWNNLHEWCFHSAGATHSLNTIRWQTRKVVCIFYEYFWNRTWGDIPFWDILCFATIGIMIICLVKSFSQRIHPSCRKCVLLFTIMFHLCVLWFCLFSGFVLSLLQNWFLFLLKTHFLIQYILTSFSLPVFLPASMPHLFSPPDPLYLYFLF